MSLKKKAGFLLLICAAVFLFAGVELNLTGNAIGDYFSGEFLSAHLGGLLLLVAGVWILMRR